MTYFALYLEVDIICLLVLSFMLTKSYFSQGHSAEAVAFRRVLYAVMVLLLSDAIWASGEHGLFPLPIWGNYLVNMAYMTLAGLAVYYWLIYVELKLDCYLQYSRRIKLLLALPLLIQITLTLLTVFNGWLFYVDAQNHYHRGLLYPLLLCLSYWNMLLAAAHPLWRLRKEKREAKRREARILASFVILPLAGGILQALCYGLPTSLAGTALSILLVYINLQEGQVSQDSLTGLNNRRRTDEYLFAHLNGTSKRRGLCLMLGDVDYFKRINDQFGHNIGDQALALTAETLKQLCDSKNIFLSRFGGDEFCVIWPAASGQNATIFAAQVNAALAAACRERDLPYTLSISFGWAEWDGVQDSVSLIAAADEMLYENKRHRVGQ